MVYSISHCSHMDVFEIFRMAANAEKAVSMSAYMRGKFPFLGIPTPERRRLSREFLKSVGKKKIDWEFVFKCWELEREFQYLAMDYLDKYKVLLTAADIANICTIAVKK